MVNRCVCVFFVLSLTLKAFTISAHDRRTLYYTALNLKFNS